MTIEMINKWQSIVRQYNKAPIPYEELVAKCAKEGLESVMVFLKNNHYISKMKDGNTFIFWSSNKYYPEATIINLKAELTNTTREPTLEEKVAILEERVARLEVLARASLNG